MSRILLSHFLGLVGAAIGGVAGFYAFGWLLNRGFYGLAIPGSFLGLGCGLLAQHRSVPRGIVCAVASLGLSLFTVWWFEYHPKNGFLYVIQHPGELSSVTLLMMGLATVIAFWVGQDAGFRLLPWSRRPAPAAESKPPSTGTGQTV